MKKSLIATMALAAAAALVAGVASASTFSPAPSSFAGLHAGADPNVQKTKLTCYNDTCTAVKKTLYAIGGGSVFKPSPQFTENAKKSGQQNGDQYIVGATKPADWIAWQVH